MFGSQIFWVQKVKAPKQLVHKSLVKIGSVTAEILLIWTNVAMTLATFKHGPKILPLNFGQNWANNI